MPKSVLVDVTRCIGCGACTVACKLWNGLVYDEQVPHSGSKAQLNERNWTILEKRQVNGSQRRYVKKQCMHCLEPACVSACPARALGWGEIEKLRAEHPGMGAAIEPLPDPAVTRPNLVILPHRDAQATGRGTGAVMNPGEL